MMTLPTDPEARDTLIVAWLDGEMPSEERVAFEALLHRDPVLRAEVEGLRAVRDLLGRDRVFGEVSGVDAPPPHLLDAIVRAEPLARPAELRAAMERRRDLEKKKPLWARMSTWLMGGGAVLLGGTAALLLVIARKDAVPQALESVAAPVSGSMSTSTIADRAANQAASGPKEVVDTPVEKRLADQKAKDLGGQPSAEAPTAAPAGTRDGAAGLDSVAGDLQTHKLEEPRAPATAAAELPNDGETAPGKKRARADVGNSARDSNSDKAGVTSLKPADGKDDKHARENLAQTVSPGMGLVGDVSGHGTGVGGVAGRGSPPPTPPAGTTTQSGPRPAPSKTKSAEQARRELADAFANKRVPAATGANDDKAADEGDSALRKPEEKRAAKKAPARDSMNPRAEIERAKRQQQAELAAAAGFRDLDNGQYEEALDSFTQARTLDRERNLGLAPVAGQVRALLALQRPFDSARLAAGLLEADLSLPAMSPAVADGARAAEQAGDLRLAERLWQKLATQKTWAKEAQQSLGRVRHKRAQMEMESAAQAPAAAAPAAEPSSDR